MSCAACSARVEKAVSKLEGVSSCNVNLLTESMTVEGTVEAQTVIQAVKEAGYEASLKQRDKKQKDKQEDSEKRQTGILMKRLAASVVSLIVLMYISMGAVMWNFPLPEYFENNPLAIGLIQMIICAVIMVINQKFFISGTKSLFRLSPNMDTLVALGSFSAFAYSTVMLFVMISNHNGMAHLHDLYFESAAMVPTLIALGKLLEAKAKGKTTNALKGLMSLAPKTAVLIKNGQEIQVDIDKVMMGDVFAVRPGESIPVDGIVIEGKSAVDESALTGESIPADKEKGSSVFAATLNKSGYMQCQAIKVGEDTAFSQIIQVVNDAAASKAPISKIADKVSGIFVPIVMGIAAVTFVIWLLLGQSFGISLARAIAVLVISCPCALGLATPVAIMVGSGVGAKNGILFKNATSLEITGKAKIIALDKTGTITLGKPKVTDVLSIENAFSNELIKTAASLEQSSEHPLAKAIVEYALENNVLPDQAEDFEAFSGNGVFARSGNSLLYGGNLELVRDKADISEEMIKKADTFASKGKTPIYFVKDKKLLGIIAVADTVKDDSKEAIERLKQMGLRVVMLTGDNFKTANAIGKTAGVDEIFADVKPQDKEKIIRDFQKDNKVIMVGDGINDAPALERADIGIAIGAGTDIAIDAADVVVMKSRLSDVVSAIRLSRGVIRNIYENLFWAFGYNIIGIPLAAGAFISILGWQLNPMFAAAAMSISSVLVVSNALRLNFLNIGIKNQSEEAVIIKKEEQIKMEKTIKIEGMMCPHCEARVKNTLEKLNGVELAQVSHENKTAVITLTENIDNEKLKNTIEEQGYKVVEIA